VIGFVTLALAHVALLAPEAGEQVVYTRADVVSAVTGEARLQRAYSKRLALRAPDCEEGEFSCTEDVIYGQIYSLRFSRDSTSRLSDGSAATDRTDRGTVLVAVDLAPDDEELLDESLLAYLEGLSAAAYAGPQAGVRFGRDPFSQRVLERSERPAWFCRELDGEHGCAVLAGDDHALRTWSRGGEDAEAACRTLEAAVEGSAPEIKRTTPIIREQIRQAVRLRSVSTFEGLTWADTLAPLPDGVTFRKRALDHERTGAIWDLHEDVFRGHEGRYDDVERDVLMPPAAVRVIEAPMWVTRWTFEATREIFGVRSETVPEPPVTVVVAVLPIEDPLMAGISRTRTPLHVPTERIVSEVVALFESQEALRPSLVVSAFSDPEIWPMEGDWLVVSCHEDGTARYGIAPFSVAATVTNPREACAAIERELGTSWP
jgi:hypothetical protein